MVNFYHHFLFISYQIAIKYIYREYKKCVYINNSKKLEKRKKLFYTNAEVNNYYIFLKNFL